MSDKKDEITSIFITGATGFIGGAIFQQIVPRKHAFKVTALVRDGERAKKLQELGAETVIGALDDSDILTEAALQHDVVIHTADASDHLGSAKAFVAGLEKRADNRVGKRKPLYIHTSGSGVLLNFSSVVGSFEEKIWTESPLGEVDGVEKTRFHREIDLVVLEAGVRGKIDTIIVSPTMIYGVSNGPFNQHSVQVPFFIKSAIKNKGAVHLNEGTNVWNNVHIMDLAELYLLILEKAIEGKAPLNRTGYYFVENGENSMREITNKIAEALHKNDKSYENKAKDLPRSDPKAEELFGALGTVLLGYNSRCKTERAKHLGWHPHRASLLETIDNEVEYWLKEEEKKKNKK